MTGLGPGKPLALLVYLAVRGEARREELVDLLWGAVPEANARNAFRQALHRLRSALGDDLLPADRDRVILTRSEALVVDRDALVAAFDQNNVTAAAEVYRGDFLEGFDVGEPLFESWVDAERLRLRSRFQSALQKGAEVSLAGGRWLEALQFVQRLSTIAPYDESAALLEANVLVAAGRGHEAVVSLRRFSELLHEQLDLPPSAKISELLSRIERSEPRPTAEPIRASTLSVPFVGREVELGRLMGAIRELRQERGATILVEGPAGIGKSRLAEEVVGRARSAGPFLLLRGRERPFGPSLPYASIAEALRGILRAPGISGTGRHLLAEAARLLPELRDNFDLPDPQPIDGEGGRLRFFEGIAALLDAAAYEQPICLLFDDMHNASASSLELLAYLSARLATSPVMMIVMYRRDSAGDGIAERLSALASGDSTPDGGILHLDRLDRRDTSRIVSSIISSAGVEDQIDPDRIIVAAEGNPMRAVELARRALSGDLLAALPTRLRDVLWARFQKATPAQRRVFFAAALLQRRASLRLLAAASHLPEATAYEAAEALAAAGLLAEEGDAFVVAHDSAIAFASEASGLAGRALLAGWAADALANEPGATGAELAHLYATAGQASLAFVNARRASFEAAAVGAAPEIQRLLGMALTLAPDAAARAEIEAMMAAFGAGRPLLTAPPAIDEPTERAAPPVSATRPATASDPAVESPPERSSATPPATEPASGRRSFATPRLYWLTALLVASTLLLIWRRSAIARADGRTLADSLLVIERGTQQGAAVSVVTGPLIDSPRRFSSVVRDEAAWTDGLPRPWLHPLPSPDKRWIAIERMTDSGTDVYLLRRDTVDRIPIAVGGGDDVALDWAPDGNSLLVRRGRTLPDGSFDADLWAYRIENGHAIAAPIDTSAARSVREARWSPDGTRIAWVAQLGADHQQDVFLVRADGSGLENLTDNPSEDYHISWSSDGSLLAFTSDRRGNPDLFALEFESGSRRLWTLTDSPYPEDAAVFSPDGRYVAFQSTRDSDAAVYVMPALGGTITRVTPPGRQFSLLGWRGNAAASFVDRFRIIGPSAIAVGDSIEISLLGVGRSGAPQLPGDVTVTLLDKGAADFGPVKGDSGAQRYLLKANKLGTVRIAAAIPGWRYDTLAIRMTSRNASGFSDAFAGGIDGARWLSLGIPAPAVKKRADGAQALYPNGDLQWQSGLLTRDAFPLQRSLDASATLFAPFGQRALPAALLQLAFVGDGREDSFDRIAPQFNEIASITWDGEASRFTYSLGAESKSDPISAIGIAPSHLVRIVIDDQRNVSFFIDGRLRWTSSLRFLGNVAEPRARIWIGGRATGAWGSIGDVKVKQP